MSDESKNKTTPPQDEVPEPSARDSEVPAAEADEEHSERYAIPTIELDTEDRLVREDRPPPPDTGLSATRGWEVLGVDGDDYLPGAGLLPWIGGWRRVGLSQTGRAVLGEILDAIARELGQPWQQWLDPRREHPAGHPLTLLEPQRANAHLRRAFEQLPLGDFPAGELAVKVIAQAAPELREQDLDLGALSYAELLRRAPSHRGLIERQLRPLYDEFAEQSDNTGAFIGLVVAAAVATGRASYRQGSTLIRSLGISPAQQALHYDRRLRLRRTAVGTRQAPDPPGALRGREHEGESRVEILSRYAREYSVRALYASMMQLETGGLGLDALGLGGAFGDAFAEQADHMALGFSRRDGAMPLRPLSSGRRRRRPPQTPELDAFLQRLWGDLLRGLLGDEPEQGIYHVALRDRCS